MARTARSPFIWHDLVTTDPAAAAPFYEGVFGWRLRGEAGGFQVLMAPEGPAAGLMQLGDEAEAHWMVHVHTPDVDQLCRRAAFLQGEVLLEPEDMEGLGRSAVLADPSGAIFSAMQLMDEAAPMGSEAFGWHALVASRPDLGARVYKTLFGYKDKALEGGRRLLSSGRQPVATVRVLGDTLARWVPYARVLDLSVAAEMVTELGGSCMTPVEPLAGGGEGCIVRDPQGALVGLMAGGTAVAAVAD